jgi:hypothetical protein
MKFQILTCELGVKRLDATAAHSSRESLEELI